MDPLCAEAYNRIAYMHLWTGDFDRSISAIDRYISLAPDEPNPYDSKGDIYAYSGRIDDAIEMYEQAIRIAPGFSMSRANSVICISSRRNTKMQSAATERWSQVRIWIPVRRGGSFWL